MSDIDKMTPIDAMKHLRPETKEEFDKVKIRAEKLQNLIIEFLQKETAEDLKMTGQELKKCVNPAGYVIVFFNRQNLDNTFIMEGWVNLPSLIDVLRQTQLKFELAVRLKGLGMIK